PHVRPGADVQSEPYGAGRGRIAVIRDDVERADERTPQGHLDADTPTREPVRPLAADLHRRRGGDRQLDLAPEGRERRVHLLPRRRVVPLDDLPLRVAGRRRRRQLDVGDIALVPSYEAWSQSSCLTGQ